MAKTDLETWDEVRLKSSGEKAVFLGVTTLPDGDEWPTGSVLARVQFDGDEHPTMVRFEKIEPVEDEPEDEDEWQEREIVAAAFDLFDNRLGWSRGANPFAPRELWARLGEALYGPDAHAVRKLRESEPTLVPKAKNILGAPSFNEFMRDGREFTPIEKLFVQAIALITVQQGYAHLTPEEVYEVLLNQADEVHGREDADGGVTAPEPAGRPDTNAQLNMRCTDCSGMFTIAAHAPTGKMRKIAFCPDCGSMVEIKLEVENQDGNPKDKPEAQTHGWNSPL